MFFDYRKAFDSVPHRPLLKKLETLGFNSHILCWITDYLTNRSQTDVVNGESSQPAPVIPGVPQGSVLGPLLFLIYINDHTDINTKNGAKITSYTDDVLLVRIINSHEDFAALQEDIDRIGSWSSANFLTLNRTKCRSLAFFTEDFITMHQVLLYFDYISPWSGPTLTMHQPSGLLI